MAAPPEEEDINVKIKEHLEQLAQVEALIATSPGDEELIKLKGDLEKVIAYSRNLAYENAGAQEPVAQVITSKWQEADRCMALWEDEKYYLARIDRVMAMEESYEVTYLQFGNTAIVPEASLRVHSPPNPTLLVPNASIRALFSEDGFFYDAMVKDRGTAPGTVLIKFTKFKTPVEVLMVDVEMRVDEVTTKELLPEKAVVPEYLKFAETDTAEQKLAKKRKMKKLKKNHNKRKREEEGLRKQSSWLSFQKKSSKLAGTRKKKSMFATHQKGRVGVVGSEKTMTKNVSRKKHEFAEEDEEDEGDDE